jgi:hypothetical protein
MWLHRGVNGPVCSNVACQLLASYETYVSFRPLPAPTRTVLPGAAEGASAADAEHCSGRWTGWCCLRCCVLCFCPMFSGLRSQARLSCTARDGAPREVCHCKRPGTGRGMRLPSIRSRGEREGPMPARVADPLKVRDYSTATWQAVQRSSEHSIYLVKPLPRRFGHAGCRGCLPALLDQYQVWQLM